MDKQERMQRLGLALAVCRDRKGLTQQALADAIGVSVKTVNNIENGRTGISLKTSLAIERQLGIAHGIVKGIEIIGADPMVVLVDSVSGAEHDEPVVAFPDSAMDPGARPVTEARLREEMDRVHDELAEIKRLLSGS